MATKYISGKGSQKLKIESVFAAVKSVVALGDEKAFLKECKERGLTMSCHVELINLVKEHLDVRQKTRNAPRSGTRAAAAVLTTAAAAPESPASLKEARLAKRVRECDDTSEC